MLLKKYRILDSMKVKEMIKVLIIGTKYYLNEMAIQY